MPFRRPLIATAVFCWVNTLGAVGPPVGFEPSSDPDTSDWRAVDAGPPAADGRGWPDAPNLYGDAFGGRPVAARVPLAPVLVRQERLTRTGPGGAPAGYFGTSGQARLLPTTVAAAGGTPVPLYGAVLLVGPAVAGLRAGDRLPVGENAAVSAAARDRAAAAGLVARFSGQSAATVTQSIVGDFQANVVEVYDFYRERSPLRVIVPGPAAGGGVGRTKVSDDNSPLPRDRVILGYDAFGGSALSASVLAVHRFSPGFEKTFLDRRASVEVRVPFASTLDPAVNADGVTGRSTRLGNVNVALKALLYGGEAFYISGGVGVGVPTADDAVIRAGDGVDLVRVRNDAFVVTPYLAALYAPGERLFTQAWVAYGTDANGCAVDVALDAAGLRRVGQITDQNLAQLDAQLGYWVYRASGAAPLRGLAPFVELHYNGTVGRADVIRAGAFQVGSLGSFNELNLTVGTSAQIGTSLLLSAGLVLPLRDAPDRTFDYQFGVRGTFFFGPTSRGREAASHASGF